MISFPSAKTQSLFPLLAPYVLLVLIHLFGGLQMQQPVVFADELGYLGNARYLAGAAHLPDLSGAAFYHFGYSIFLIPAFLLFSDPVQVYRAIMVINAFLISSLYFSLFYILHTVLGKEKKVSIVISFVTCLYPAFLLQSNIAWAENAFIPFYGLTIAGVGILLNHKSYPAAVLFGFLV